MRKGCGRKMVLMVLPRPAGINLVPLCRAIMRRARTFFFTTVEVFSFTTNDTGSDMRNNFITDNLIFIMFRD